MNGQGKYMTVGTAQTIIERNTVVVDTHETYFNGKPQIEGTLLGVSCGIPISSFS